MCAVPKNLKNGKATVLDGIGSRMFLVFICLRNFVEVWLPAMFPNAGK